MGAIQAFNPYEPRYVRMETDEEGVVPESLETVLQRGQVKFVYLVPTFQNPTGKTLSLKRREEIAQIICWHNALLVEDDPYSMLRYRGDPLPPIYTFYAPRQQAMLDGMAKYFPSSFSWTKPEGGMFIWAEGLKDLDLEQVYYRAIERNVAYVPGKFFFTEPGEGISTMRLNFTCSDVSTLEHAIRTLGEVLAEAIGDLPIHRKQETANSAKTLRSVHAI